jgi:hypothetical protein
MTHEQSAAQFYSQTLDNPDRRHEPDGFGPLSYPAPGGMTVEARQSVLLEAQGLVHGTRNDDYGHPLDEYTRTAGMVNSLLAHKLNEPLEPEDLAMMMCCLKMSRQMNRQKRDCMVDLAGYAEVIQWMIDERAARSGS